MEKLEIMVVSFGKDRFAIADKNTGEILDDAQGYGYRTRKKAFAAWSYKHQDPEKKSQREKKEASIKEWIKAHRSFTRTLEDVAFELWTDERKGVDAKLLKTLFDEEGFTDLPFTPAEFLKVWNRKS